MACSALGGRSIPACTRWPDNSIYRSLRPLVEKAEVRGWRDEFLYEHHFGPKIIPPSEGVRNERWKYVRYLNESPVVEELFDLKRDPLEARNLVGEARHAETLVKMRERWRVLGEEWK